MSKRSVQATRQVDELDHLLRSLDDLDDEFAAGDLDRSDYDTLRNDYTVRIADEMRRVKGEQISAATDDVGRTRRWLLVTAVVGLFAVGAGVLVAYTAGERGVNDGLTGTIDENPRQKTLRCQQLGTTGQMLESLECFDEVLLEDPQNVEAMTYRGWYLMLTTSSAEQAGNTEEAIELMASAISYLDRAVALDPGYADARAFRSVVYDRLGQSEAACDEIEALLALDPPDFFVQQTEALADRNGC